MRSGEKDFGKDEVDGLCHSLRNITDQLALDLPWGLPSDLELIESDGFHPRSGTTVINLPLPALLSRVLLLYALDFYKKSHASLGISANVIRVLGKDPVKAAELSTLTGGSLEQAILAGD
jgi:hypothetical protein